MIAKFKGLLVEKHDNKVLLELNGITYEILRAIKSVEEYTGWQSNEPSTPFQGYPKGERRY